jgi:hypothetical protein
MLDRFAGKFLSLGKVFGVSKRKWVEMKVDRLYFEQQTDRYFLILKAAGKQGSESVFITIGNVLDESILPGLFLKSDSSQRIFRQLGLKIKRIRILKKMNAPDSAECVIRSGLFSKTVSLSTIEAVRMASENHVLIQVPREIIRADKHDLLDKNQSFDSAHNSVYSFKFLDKDFQNNQEVIM